MKLRKQLATIIVTLVLFKIALQQLGVALPVYVITIYHLAQGALCGISCYTVYLERGMKGLYSVAAFIIFLIVIVFAGQLFIRNFA